MAEQCDPSAIETPTHLAVGRALRRCFAEALRDPEPMGWKINFDRASVLHMIETWAERGMAESVPYFDECVELVTANSQITAQAREPLARLEVVPYQEYLVALTGVTRLLADPRDDLELLSWFLSGSGRYGSCDFQNCLEHIRNQTHDYCFFNVDWLKEWRLAVDAFNRVTMPAAALVQWLSPKPPCEFEEPMI
ncbi:MAG: hypothetical protein ACIAS6_07110 [Phycisphaerales bacterium JB060]